MIKTLVPILAVMVAVSFSAPAACAQLTSMSYGFPMILQTSNAVAYVQDTANAIDYETAAVDFTPFVFGAGVSMSFPSISQTSLQAQSMTHTEYSQTNSFAEFAYPFAGVGTSVFPGFGI
jgi:hypothetical protein